MYFVFIKSPRRDDSNIYNVFKYIWCLLNLLVETIPIYITYLSIFGVRLNLFVEMIQIYIKYLSIFYVY